MANGMEGRELVSYLTLRRLIGLIGVALPIVLALFGFVFCGCLELQPSISDYYHQRTRDLFVGSLCTIGWFLFTYRGYDRRDEIAGNLACLFALGVAFFPNRGGAAWEGTVHYASAAALFGVLAYFSICLFTRSSGTRTREKLIRNRIYRTCGVAILACMAAIGLCSWLLKETVLAELKPVFWLEAVALWAFGFSWFIKGETLWRDAD